MTALLRKPPQPLRWPASRPSVFLAGSIEQDLVAAVKARPA